MKARFCEACNSEFVPDRFSRWLCRACRWTPDIGDPAEGYGADSDFNEDVLPGC